jgi:hypothetical protein
MKVSLPLIKESTFKLFFVCRHRVSDPNPTQYMLTWGEVYCGVSVQSTAKVMEISVWEYCLHHAQRMPPPSKTPPGLVLWA